MNTKTTKTTILTLACSALLTAPPVLAQADDQLLADAADLVTSLVDPARQDATDKEAPVSNTMKNTVNTLLSSHEIASIRLLGDAAIPVLGSLTQEASVLHLLRSKSWTKRHAGGPPMHPLVALREISSTRGLKLMLDFQESDRERFDLLRRTGYTPLSPKREEFNWDLTSDTDKAVAVQMLSRALKDPSYSEVEKLEMACAMFERGLETEASRNLIAQNIDAAISHGLGDKGIQEFIIGSGDVAQLPLKQALTLANFTSDGTTFLALLESPHLEVRTQVLSELGARELGFEVSRVAALKALDDQDVNVTRLVDRIITRRLVDSGGQLSRADLTRIAEFYGRARLSDTSNIYRLYTKTLKAIKSARTEEDLMEVERLTKAVFDAPLTNLQGNISGQLPNSMNAPRIAAAFYRGLIASEFADPKFIESFRRVNRPSNAAERAIYALDTYTAHDPSSDSTQLPYFTGDLGQLPVERYAEALDWLGRTGPHFDLCSGVEPSSWRDGAATLRQSAYDETAPWKERAMAIIGLFSSTGVTEEDSVRCGDILGMELSDLEQRELFLKLLDIRNGEVKMPLAHQWNGAMARVYAAEGVASGVKEQLPLSYSPTDPAILQGMLEAAGAETAPLGTSTRFEGLAYVTAPLAAKGVLDIPESLLTNWIYTGTSLTDLVTFVLTSERQRPINTYRDLMIEALRSSEGKPEMKALAREILRFPGADSAVRLIDTAAALNSRYLTEEVRIQVARLIDLRSLKAQWTKTDELPTKSSAIVDLLALLKSDTEAVRLEAMRGLGSLGAVEAIPHLIGYVDTGNENEKARALEVLAQLNERATKAPTGSK